MKLTAIEKIPRKQIKTPSWRLQVFATVLTALEELPYSGDQEFVWRQIGAWKGFKQQ